MGRETTRDGLRWINNLIDTAKWACNWFGTAALRSCSTGALGYCGPVVLLL